MIHLILVALPALAAAPAGFKSLTSGNDCTIYRGPAESDGTTPVFAECIWKDVSVDKLNASLANWEGHANVHQTIVSSKVEKTEGNRSLVYQEHKLSSVSNREVRIWMEKSTSGTTHTYSWKNDAPITDLKSGNVATTKHVGFWKVTPLADGGAQVDYQLSYNPGGSVPGFLIKWFQGSGTVKTTEELRAAGK